MENKDRILAILQEVNEDVDFEAEKNLVDDELLTSLDVFEIITDLDEEFDIKIPASAIVPKNFNSLESICALVEGLL